MHFVACHSKGKNQSSILQNEWTINVKDRSDASFDFFQIRDIKDDVEYYIDNCMEPDFMENDTLYEEIDGLEEMLLEVKNAIVSKKFLKILTIKNWDNFSVDPGLWVKAGLWVRHEADVGEDFLATFLDVWN